MDCKTLCAEFGDDAARVWHNAIPVVGSYLDAAAVLAMPIELVQRQVLAAAQLFVGCPACRHSRAAPTAVDFAQLHRALPLHERECRLNLVEATCRSFDPICPPWDRPPSPPEARDE